MSLSGVYQNLVLTRPRLVLSVLAIITLVGAWYSQDFELDASSESLVLENDESLAYYRETREDYGTDEFLIVTYTPKTDLLSDESLEGLRSLRDQFLAIDSVETVNSILDAPIIYTAEKKLSDLDDDLQTLEGGGLDKETATQEFITNPFYKDLLVSEDGKTTALQIIFKFDERQYELINERERLQEIASVHGLNDDEERQLTEVNEQIRQHNSQMLHSRAEDVESIRQIMDGERDKASMFLGGLPMIVSDMIDYIRSDLVVFGFGVLVFLVLVLSVFFRHVRWVVLPLFCCAITAVWMFGFLGFMDWRITVISSNFMSILLIITLSLTIHLIVRFRDLQIEHHELLQLQLTQQSINSMAIPCFYTILTTMVAFASLVVSNIRPVIDFGWVMIIGLAVAFVISFLLFPSSLSLMGSIKTPPERDFTRNFTIWLSMLVRKGPRTIIIIALIIGVVVGIGMMRLKVENRFIDNFKSSTEIYQGMIVIDRALGGTTPLEFIIDPKTDDTAETAPFSPVADETDELFMEFFDEQDQNSYWLNPTMMDTVKAIQDYLDEIPIMGKVLSLATVVRIAERLNRNELDAFELALIHKRVPEQIRTNLIDPYYSEQKDQVRFSARVIESDPSLNRQQLLNNIHDYLVDELGLQEDQVHLTGMLVLYNNMLQSLFGSQIMTLGAVLLAIFITFILLFRHFILALLGIIPNIFSAVMVLGIMGWFRIPLDMMTITIASITIGIAVDDTIHYIHRFKREYPLHKDYESIVSRCHGSIGKAMFYTSVAIIFGFGILALSNFIPTINFGILTGIAMLVALLGNLLLLPALILLVKPTIKLTESQI